MFGVGVFLCVLSLLLPVGFSDAPRSPDLGWFFLIFGTLFGWLDGFYAGFANIAGIAATLLYVFRCYVTSMICGILCLLFAQNAMQCFDKGIQTGAPDQLIVDYLTPSSYGFFSWLAGISLVFLAALA
jgi:hypothetical protein